eukprot:365333-Chlamydomonas_euryale.AAC.2
MDGWMDGLMDGWMDGWMDGCVCYIACISASAHTPPQGLQAVEKGKGTGKGHKGRTGPQGPDRATGAGQGHKGQTGPQGPEEKQENSKSKELYAAPRDLAAGTADILLRRLRITEANPKSVMGRKAGITFWVHCVARLVAKQRQCPMGDRRKVE